MRSSSSGMSRKTERRIKIAFLIFALLFGIFMSLATKWHLFALKEIKTEPADILPQSVVSGNITRFQEHFWLALYITKRNYEKKFDQVYPMQTKLTVSGWGKLKLKINLTEPIFKLCWNGKYWYVSENNTIWSEDIRENEILTLEKLQNMPVLFWADDRTAPYEIGSASNNIKKCALPVNQINAWYRNMRTLKWLDKVMAIRTEADDSQQAVRLIFKDKSGHSGVSVLMPDNADDWPVVGLAVNKICPDLQALTQNDFIDATYKSKILIKNAVQ